jgi:hypothetical protein
MPLYMNVWRKCINSGVSRSNIQPSVSDFRLIEYRSIRETFRTHLLSWKMFSRRQRKHIPAILCSQYARLALRFYIESGAQDDRAGEKEKYYVIRQRGRRSSKKHSFCFVMCGCFIFFVFRLSASFYLLHKMRKEQYILPAHAFTGKYRVKNEKLCREG